jgi:predicted Zn-dependent peptidase
VLGKILTCISVFSALASAQPELRVPFQRYRLHNGLTVILHEDHRLPEVVVDLWFRVGSKDEAARRTGFAHLFEHLMFMGTHNVPNGRFDGIMEAEGGVNNASTNEDRTNYFEMGPSHLLETFLWLEADRLATLADDMSKPKVDLQREVVKNERRQSYENRPYGRVELVLPEKMFPLGHPYHHPVIGSHVDLTAASVDDVKRFFRSHYVPANLSLVIAGDFKSDEARVLIEKWFGWMPRSTEIEPAHVVPPPAELAKDARVEMTEGVKLDQVTLAWHSPAQLARGEPETELVAALLGSGKSSRLSRALIYEQHLAQEVSVEQRGMQYGGLLVVQATCAPGHHAAELERAILAELRDLDGKRPPGEDEVERARAFVETRVLGELEPLFGTADALNEAELLRGDPGELERSWLARFSSLGASDIAWQAHALLARPHLTVVVHAKN